MNNKLKNILSILEERTDKIPQEKIITCHKNALEWECIDRLPLVIAYPFPNNNKFIPYPYHETWNNPEKMLFNELLYAFNSSIYLHDKVQDDLPYTIRANFGTILMASILGGNVEQRDDQYPWILHFETEKDFLSIFDNKNRNYSILKKVIDTYKYYLDILGDYPKLKQILNIVLPDLQGPLDTLEQLRGSSVYADTILNTNLVKKSLMLIADEQIKTTKYLFSFISNKYENYTFQHNVMIKGNILIRNDSAVMISPEMYKDLVQQYDDYVLTSLKTGGIHSCGKIDFNVPSIFEIDNLKCFDFGQSYLNDFDQIYSLAKEKRIPLLRLRPNKELLLSKTLKKKYPTGVSLVYDADSFEEACYISKEYTKLYGNDYY